MFDLLGQPIDCLLGFAGGGEDGAFVVLEDLQPIRDVGGMIGARFAFQVQFGGKKCTSEFGDEFLGGVALRTEAIA